MPLLFRGQAFSAHRTGRPTGNKIRDCRAGSPNRQHVHPLKSSGEDGESEREGNIGKRERSDFVLDLACVPGLTDWDTQTAGVVSWKILARYRTNTRDGGFPTLPNTYDPRPLGEINRWPAQPRRTRIFFGGPARKCWRDSIFTLERRLSIRNENRNEPIKHCPT
ncbi:Hypothetical protein NTJ_06531 [Nesidiocoris tenuis]|uniref:Uncharacterized protein n=1 Tax=Nesidiocoris tenuis TaxID=355587 RepID=A0ABN7AQV8_9HEMI|nr:Hypothetical protein NTJ_06531 [Nesidiocoris tenuis]